MRRTEPKHSHDELLNAVLAKRASLIERDSVLLAEQLRLEGQGISPMPPSAAPDPRRMAQELLNGFAGPELPSGAPEARLYSIILDRQATQIAIDALVSSELRARAIAVATHMEASGQDWAKIQRRRCLALLELRAANRAAARFREQVTALAGVAPGLLNDRIHGPLFRHPPVVGDGCTEFLEGAVRAGFVSAREVSGDG